MIKDGLRNICRSLGKNNDPVIAVLGIAVFKGIFRPAFTMMDKNEKPERKKYAAFREGLTEAVAFCSYLGTAAIAKSLAKPICKLAKDQVITNEKGVKEFKNLHKVQKSLSFIAVCTAAVAIIPAICNITLKPIMEASQKLYMNKKLSGENNPPKLDIKETIIKEKPTKISHTVLSENSKKLLTNVRSPQPFRSSDMKVGG